MSEQKYYVIGATTPEAWQHVHDVLTADGTLEDNIPTRAIECTDLKEHSDTRAVYLMTDEEAEQLSNHPDIKFIQINVANYPDTPRPPPEDLHNTPRYSANAKCYNNFVLNGLPSPATSAELNRSGYQLLRCNQYASPWYGVPSTTVYSNTIPNTTGTGTNIDVIVGDDGCWFGHVEFNRSASWPSTYGPTDYVGGNKLPGNGTCDLLDVVLDGPYYIDPAWFNASPGTRLTTRWDGTTVPVESVAREWWGNSSARSSQFASAGTVTINELYTRANCNGNNTTQSTEGNHGTACAGLTYGRTFGWAYNANKWFINAYGTYGLWPVDNYFDVVKIFHQNKPVNPLFGQRDPTITSNSWGFRATTPSTGYYYFRQGTTGAGGVAYSSKPAFMAYIGNAGDGGRCKGEMLTNNLTTAGDELISAGVIFVAAAGNSNQKQVGSNQADYNNYWSTSAATALSSAVHDEFGSTCYNTTSRRGFPQQIGKYTSGGVVVYPAINIGALDDNYQVDGKERKVGYSDMGEQIDCYTPADGTMTSNRGYSAYARYDQITGYLTSTDASFSGTSAACPVATGLIAAKLQYNRDWNWEDIRTWLQTIPLQQATTFYQGPDPSTATSADWSDINSLMGGTRRVLYNELLFTGTMAGPFTMSSGLSWKTT